MSEITSNFRVGMIQKWCASCPASSGKPQWVLGFMGTFWGFASSQGVSTEYWEGWKRHSALLCCHSQSHEPSPGSPYISRCCQGWHRTQHQRDHSAASSLAFLSEMMTPCFWWWRTSAQHVLVLQAAQVMSLPQGRAQPPPCSSALGQPAAASCQPLPPPSRFQSWRGFPELKYLAYK